MSPDGSRFAIVTGDGFKVQVRSADTSRLLQTLNADNPIGLVAFNPGKYQIVGADIYGQVEVWNGAGKAPKTLGKPIYLNDLRFNQSGSEFLTASESGTITVWDARDDRLLNPIDACSSPRTAAFSHDDSKIVVACLNGTVQVFSVLTGQMLAVLQASTDGIVTDASFSPDGKNIVAAIDAGNSGYVQIWNSELATFSLSALERIAEQRVTEKLTPAQQQQYLTGF